MRIYSHPRGRLLPSIALGIGALTIVWPSNAFAHVKWFSAFDVAAAPRSLTSVLSPAFGGLFLISLVALWAACLIERTAVGSALVETLDRICALVRPGQERLLRAFGGAFFVSLWVLGNVIITPELKTQSPMIPWLQLGIAVGLFWRPTMILSGLGIVALYVIGVANYGIFHLLDYPIFLGLAGFFIASGLDVNPLGLRPIDIARWGAGLTLMWASIEKWAYPDWTYPLLAAHPRLAFGWDAPLYMVAAGIIEFALAFGLIWTRMVRRLSSLVLLGMFISAILEFGKIDAIGHSMIIAILIAVLADGGQKSVLRPLWAPIFYACALAIYLGLYYGLHVVLFGAA